MAVPAFQLHFKIQSSPGALNTETCTLRRLIQDHTGKEDPDVLQPVLGSLCASLAPSHPVCCMSGGDGAASCMRWERKDGCPWVPAPSLGREPRLENRR